MGWKPDGRSYTRLEGALDRLKTVSIKAENAFWDNAARRYITVAFGILILFLIETLVLRRLLRINRALTSITESLDFTKTLPIQGKDEIAELSTSINCMVCAMSEVLNTVHHPSDRP